MSEVEKSQHVRHALQTITIEIEALQTLRDNIDEKFVATCETIMACQGHVVVICIGKSGHIASKIAATFASTGTPAFFVHPAEAGHGDFGMITKKDIVVAISNSGNTPELTALTPMIKMLNIPLIAITSKVNSVLAQAADIVLNLGVTKEACPLNLSPTSSTTTALVLGDALAISLLKARNFTAKDFASSHPSGSLGKKLLLTVKSLMHTGKNIPIVSPETTVEETILEVSSKALGVCFISGDGKSVEGVFTDGDLRRVFESNRYRKGIKIKGLMTCSPKTIHENAMAIDALEMMNLNKITAIATVNDDNHLTGVIHMHDLVKAGIA